MAGGLAALLAFRLFQPYAFSGLGLNPAWLANIRELQAQSSGDSDVPFALQWARRSHLYSLENLVRWGLGLPLGILAWTGFAWMGWRVARKDWRHALLWGWTALYFLWQSLAFNPTMRYQLPIYPLLCMMAAWLIFEIPRFRIHPSASRILSGALAAIVLLSTFAWAFAFTRIYTRPHTRVAATRWIYQNVPGPINLRIQSADGELQQPLAFPYGGSVQPGAPHIASFTANASGELTEIFLPHAVSLNGASLELTVIVARLPDAPLDQALAAASIASDFQPAPDGRGRAFTLVLDRPVSVVKDTLYFLRLESTGALSLSGAAPINESSWDDGLPLRIDNYDGFGGLYDGTLNFEMYWDDNPDKLNRFVTTLDQGEYIFMTSNRQWASIPRVPERYPLTTEYYRLLVGCPPDEDIVWCYNVARPGKFEEQLGYELVQVFESYPPGPAGRGGYQPRRAPHAETGQQLRTQRPDAAPGPADGSASGRHMVRALRLRLDSQPGPSAGHAAVVRLYFPAGSGGLSPGAPGAAGTRRLRVSPGPRGRSGPVGLPGLAGRIAEPAVHPLEHRGGPRSDRRDGRRSRLAAPRRPARRVEFQPPLLPDGRGPVPGGVPPRSLDPARQFGPVAPGQGRRAADGLLVFQRGAAKHDVPAV
jgi:hypothetical protein